MVHSWWWLVSACRETKSAPLQRCKESKEGDLQMNRSEMLNVVKANILKIVEDVDESQISEDVSMRDLGADSLQIVEVVSRSMKELRLKVPRTDLSKARNLKQLLDLFEKAAAQEA